MTSPADPPAHAPATSPSHGDVRVNGLKVHYRELGTGPAVLLLHGWPTSSFLWRNVMPRLARRHRVVALDLPGFGASDKPLDARYSFEFHRGVLDGALAALGIDALSVVVHDLGGPVGLDWVVHHPERVTKLALLNTLVYPSFSWAVAGFLLGCRTPGVRNWLTSRGGLEVAMKIGMRRRDRLTPEVIEGVCGPFRDRDARRVLLKTATDLSPRGLAAIARALPSLRMPVRLIHGERDRILPDVARTMARVQRDLPQALATSLPDGGHFLQEDAPDEVGALLAEFLEG